MNDPSLVRVFVKSVFGATLMVGATASVLNGTLMNVGPSELLLKLRDAERFPTAVGVTVIRKESNPGFTKVPAGMTVGERVSV
jgi:hypothetical protein